ncbi:uncharacterized protein [Nerophis lumbriciformis]|uniref:uncharacterized protein n=1 Tax=Nerophis lumbriciformis TaxID=546530 RepID=UPI003BAABA0E
MSPFEMILHHRHTAFANWAAGTPDEARRVRGSQSTAPSPPRAQPTNRRRGAQGTRDHRPHAAKPASDRNPRARPTVPPTRASSRPQTDAPGRGQGTRKAGDSQTPSQRETTPHTGRKARRPARGTQRLPATGREDRPRPTGNRAPTSPPPTPGERGEASPRPPHPNRPPQDHPGTGPREPPTPPAGTPTMEMEQPATAPPRCRHNCIIDTTLTDQLKLPNFHQLGDMFSPLHFLNKPQASVWVLRTIKEGHT